MTLAKEAVVPVRSIIGERLSKAAFQQLAGTLAGYPFVKFVIDKDSKKIHFLNNAFYKFHADYIGENILGITVAQVEKDIDRYNEWFYFDPNRRFYLGVLSLHERDSHSFFAVETVEVDRMDSPMIQYFFSFLKENVDPNLPLLFKPSNHIQENAMAELDATVLPRIFARELFATSNFIALNTGETKGRLRAFASEKEYESEKTTLMWFDIIVMARVPDSIPRLSGIINAQHTTPLSHTNVLATGWQIPNAIQLDIMEQIEKENLNNAWVEYRVAPNASGVHLRKIDKPIEVESRPSWSTAKIRIEEPEVSLTPVVSLEKLRMSDAYKFGTKAANIGELYNIKNFGSERLLGFYEVRRPPRKNLIPYIAKYLGVSESGDVGAAASKFVQSRINIPRGIAIPFSVQQKFLESSPKLQQAIGKLKMALELNARQIDSLCVALQQQILQTRFSDDLKRMIDRELSRNLSGVKHFVVRSSSNAEDLENFSAAGIYESVNHVSTAENIFDSIKVVWSSLLSARSVRLRQDVGISLDDSYMGVVIQEECQSTVGGVMVTTNPTNRGDFRNVYLNISPKSVQNIVQGADQPFQYLYNTVEGGGHTLSTGSSEKDLPSAIQSQLQELSFVGRLLQSHFSPDYTFGQPVDVEWLIDGKDLYILQLRPFS